jgi:hypothetical protein
MGGNFVMARQSAKEKNAFSETARPYESRGRLAPLKGVRSGEETEIYMGVHWSSLILSGWESTLNFVSKRWLR